MAPSIKAMFISSQQPVWCAVQLEGSHRKELDEDRIKGVGDTVLSLKYRLGVTKSL